MVILDPKKCHQFHNAATWLCDELDIIDGDRYKPIDEKFEQAFNCSIIRPYPFPQHLEQVRVVFYNDEDATAFLLRWS